MTPFDISGKKKLFETSWEKEKILVTTFSPFPTMFLLYQRQKLSFILHLFCVCKCFQFEQGQIFVVWEWVKHSLI